MIEVEIKLPVNDKERIEQKLRQQGFEARELVKESDIYFNSEERDFNKSDEALRIRHIKNLSTGEDSSVLTYKGPKLDTVSMTRRELETGIEDAEICKEILVSLGYSKQFPVVKSRQHYCLDNMTACVDQVEGLGDFLELEVIVAGEKDKEAALIKIENVLNQLGHDMSETTRRSYLSMLQKKSVR